MRPYHKRKLTLVEQPRPLFAGQTLVLYNNGVAENYTIAVCSMADLSGVETIIATKEGVAIILSGNTTSYMHIDSAGITKRNWDNKGFAEYESELYSISLMADSKTIAFWKPEELQVPRPVLKYDHVVSTDGVTWIVEYVSPNGNVLLKRERAICSTTLCPIDTTQANYFNIEYR